MFLPARIFFYNYVSTWWVGSFGIMTIILILMLYLVKKEKLGYVGRIWKKQIMKISKGKLGIFTIISLIFSITMLSTIVWITDMNRNTEEMETYVKLLREEKGVKGLFDLYSFDRLKTITDASLNEWYNAFVTLYEHPQSLGIMYAIIDEMTYNYHQHFNIVFLIEAVESLCFVLYFRFFYGKKQQINGETKSLKTIS